MTVSLKQSNNNNIRLAIGKGSCILLILSNEVQEIKLAIQENKLNVSRKMRGYFSANQKSNILEEIYF